MNKLKSLIKEYLYFCKYNKRLDLKTLKAYEIDLLQFSHQTNIGTADNLIPDILEEYIRLLNLRYKPKTVRRKLASIKSFCRYLEYKDIITQNPFNKIHFKFREPVTLPKTIPLHTIVQLLSTIYRQRLQAKTPYQRRNALRDIAVIELLFATGMRITELCSLRIEDIDFLDWTLLIHGKGAKERKIQIENQDVIKILMEYMNDYMNEINQCNFFFVNQSGFPLSDQTVRRMIKKYASLASIPVNITPHMFRHTFATSLLEADVDIRYIQKMLGHSSINITEIYAHVAMNKQRQILAEKHPRNSFQFLTDNR